MKQKQVVAMERSQATAQSGNREAEKDAAKKEFRKRHDAEMEKFAAFKKLLFNDGEDRPYQRLHEDSKTLAVFA